ncbi:aminotransferase class IV [Desulfobacca acetoxidans]|uniref:Aminotransferase class IV n=1 Tax=Desulfobacca acetoxidans (strain ATCC 700848 / DSM 11109 / ASRB2) TaxID=880072 RepID=F2NFN4_DESAR|nr:aminotransferase class IV [Desulfobacca acetoxidans]AEB10153.1 aminotransferase class IV [Desulfobacca acetoxidans DSM 11109]
MDIFLNGQFLPLSEAKISVQDRGLLYGDGLFETIRAEAGRPWWLAEHLARLSDGAAILRITLPPDFPWGEHLRELVARNGLKNQIAAAKIIITRGEAPELGLPRADRPTLIISARPYTPPTPGEYRQGWPVVSFAERRSSFLGQCKSLNYLFCLAARQYALDRGAREGLILEADGTVSEGAATGIFWRENGVFFRPLAPSALPSVTLAVLQRALRGQGVAFQVSPASLARLARAEGVWLANSLIGVMPVSSLDGCAVPMSPDTKRLNDLLWSEVA